MICRSSPQTPGCSEEHAGPPGLLSGSHCGLVEGRPHGLEADGFLTGAFGETCIDLTGVFV